MKRDIALVKAILKYVEKNDENNGRVLPAPEFPGYTEEQVNHHIDICGQAGFVTTQSTSGGSFLRSLTWAGHNELERLRAG